MNGWHGNGQMQKQTKKILHYYKHSKGGYARLPLGNVYRCHRIFPTTCKFEKIGPKTFFPKLLKKILNGGFGNP